MKFIIKKVIASKHIYRRLLRLLVASGLLAAATGVATATTSASQVGGNIVLVHGAFADGSSWGPVISRLQAMGYRVTAVQNPLTSLADDVKATKRVLKRQEGSVLLVGHSWGGVVITQAGNVANVKGLVYLSALVPANGESAAELLHRHAVPNGLVPDADGIVWLDNPQSYRETMAGDLPLTKVQELVAVQQPISASSFSEKIHHAAWHEKPSWYLHTENDHALPPAVQKAIADEIGAKITSISSSHMSILSHPDEVANLIDKAAKESGISRLK